ncbi:non-homologous end-joining DNA ligase [Cellulomonas sp. URHD0024]|uniref:non-homologous end-joining DNA ligase n=1 Tax=Cellulomonas sp. URHD0024 TaxID=1302620 RepID=UPI00040CDF12|nr:non-homologous end-joining DNA ligase [Cellulomonas sp. URHD0024]
MPDGTHQSEPLDEYRAKRDPARTPEPVPAPGAVPGAALSPGAGRGFVVQEHHARALHWDFRLERDGVLVSWAVPKGLPLDQKTNHLAVHTEDHPLEYATFEGEIGAGEYGGGQVTVWDRGTYDLVKWSPREVQVVLHGERVQGRYVLFATGAKGAAPDAGKNWMVHRMDPPTRPDWEPVPALVRPMLAVPGDLPEDDEGWAYEMKWDGVRAVAYVDGGRVRLMSRNDLDITRSYPEVARMGEQLGSTPVVLDGELVAFDAGGAPDFGRLQQRMHVADPAVARRLARSVPVVYLVFDVLHLDGRSTLDLPYDERRTLLERLGLAGPSWQTPASFPGPGADVLAASRENRLEGVLVKRRSATYRPGRRSSDWLKVKHVHMQEVVVVGWRPGKGRRANTIGSLVLAVPQDGVLRPVGGVGTGFTDRMLDDLRSRLLPLERPTSPFQERLPSAEVRDVRWVRPELVGEVAYTEWTGDGRLRHPAWRGLRPDKDPHDVEREI